VFHTDEIFVEWKKWGPIAGFWEPSFFDDTPVHYRINSRLRPFMKKVAYQSVNINDGTIYKFDETLDPKLQGESVAASASIPVAFQPTSSIGDLKLVDGGTFSDLNLQDAIDRCREDTTSDSDIIVDVVMCQTDPVKIAEVEAHTYFKPYHYYKRRNDF
jgi:predicted acylesterase/phospholipase RssA